MSLLSDTGRLRQVCRGSSEFFVINSGGILHGFPWVRMYSSEQGPHHRAGSPSLRDDSREGPFPPVIQVTLGGTGRGARCAALSPWLRLMLLFRSSTNIGGQLFTPGIAGGTVISPRRSIHRGSKLRVPAAKSKVAPAIGNAEERWWAVAPHRCCVPSQQPCRAFGGDSRPCAGVLPEDAVAAARRAARGWAGTGRAAGPQSQGLNLAWGRPSR